MSKKTLGRGLESLFPGSTSTSNAVSTDSENRENGITTISIDKITANPDQPRKEFNEEALQDLSNSIREKGVLQPIMVEPKGDDAYEIIAGERRFRASKLAGLSEVPVIVRTFSEEEKYEIALIENIQREDLTPIEESLGYKKLLEISGFSQDELGKRLGKSRSAIANSLRLLKLPQEMQQSLMEREITAGHAKALLSVVNPADMQVLYGRIIRDGLSVREAEAISTELNNGVRGASFLQSPKSAKKASGSKIPELRSLEQKLIDTLGTKVAIKGSSKKGKIEITYFSMDDLERLYDIISE